MCQDHPSEGAKNQGRPLLSLLSVLSLAAGIAGLLVPFASSVPLAVLLVKANGICDEANGFVGSDPTNASCTSRRGAILPAPASAMPTQRLGLLRPPIRVRGGTHPIQQAITSRSIFAAASAEISTKGPRARHAPRSSRKISSFLLVLSAPMTLASSTPGLTVLRRPAPSSPKAAPSSVWQITATTAELRWQTAQCATMRRLWSPTSLRWTLTKGSTLVLGEFRTRMTPPSPLPRSAL